MYEDHRQGTRKVSLKGSSRPLPPGLFLLTFWDEYYLFQVLLEAEGQFVN